MPTLFGTSSGPPSGVRYTTPIVLGALSSVLGKNPLGKLKVPIWPFVVYSPTMQGLSLRRAQRSRELAKALGRYGSRLGKTPQSWDCLLWR